MFIIELLLEIWSITSVIICFSLAVFGANILGERLWTEFMQRIGYVSDKTTGGDDV